MANDEIDSFDVVIVGAGISGLIAAKTLSEKGLQVVLLEKSRGVGGRMATRRLGGQSMDHGAQFFTAQGESDFRQVCREWLFTGVIKPWFGRPGQVRYCGIKSMNAVAKELAQGLDVRNECLVTKVSEKGGLFNLYCGNGEIFCGKKLLFTAPAPQSLAILKASDVVVESELLEALGEVSYERCIALLALLEDASGMIAPGILKLENDSVFMTIADSQLKGTSRRPGIVALSSHEWAAENYDREAGELEQELVEALKERIEIEPLETYVHKWKYAHRNGSVGAQRFARSISKPIWFAGDSFGEAKVQGAYLSGVEAAQSILES